jgi:hypothetical protein
MNQTLLYAIAHIRETSILNQMSAKYLHLNRQSSCIQGADTGIQSGAGILSLVQKAS